MSKIARKLGVAAIALVTIVSVSGITPAAAQTTAELQAQIAALSAQITALQTQLGGSTTTGGTTTTYNFTRDLTLGSTGEDVRALQQYLNAKGFVVAASGAGSVGNESTYFGALTKTALAKFQAANGISPAAGYFGAITRAKIASMGGTSTTPTTPAAGAMSISLASDNPASANVQKGSANNQVLKFVITGGSAPVSITGLTLKSYGTAEATGSRDVSAVKLFDENGVQIGNDRTPAGNQVNFVIVPALTIPANSSRTVTVTANIGSEANTMAIVRYGIESASAVMGGSTLTGSYPIMGGNFTIVPAGQLGTLTVGQLGSLPKGSVKVGEKDIVLERFNVSAGSNEDIAVNQVILTRTAGSDSSVSNVRLRRVGETTVLAGPVSFSNKKATFNLASPITLTKGSSMNLDIIADIADGATSPISYSIAAGGVVGRGTTSGTNVTSTGTTTANNITVGNETLTVSMSTSHPQGSESFLVKTTNRRDLAKFDLRANGGDVILNSIKVKVSSEDTLGDDDYIAQAGLYDGDSLISDLISIDTNATDETFSLDYTLPANTTKTLTLKGITNGLSAATNDLSVITTTFSYYSGYGLASGETVSSDSDVAATGVTVYKTGTTTNAADTTKTPYNQAILAPSNNVTLASLKVYAQREDMKLTDAVITIAGTNYDDEDDISSITLYADDGVTALTNPIAYDAGAGNATTDTFTIASADIINDIVFTKGVYKTLLVKANVSSSAADDATGVTVTIANAPDQLVFIGQDSGTEYDASDAAGVTFAIASPYAGGTFSFDTKVVTLQKASTSPSAVSRGTQTVTGVWDVNNYDSANAAAVLTDITFTSKTGLPSGLVDADDDTLFSLYDGEGNLLAGGSGDDAGTTLVQASGTVAFSSVDLTINPGEPKQLKLVIDTTNTAKFASNTQIQWSLEVVGNATVTDGEVGYASGIWTIPAVANVVTLP